MAEQPRYMGGQAVVEGVMMRGESSWAVAVRTPEGDIDIDLHEAPRWAEKYGKYPAAARRHQPGRVHVARHEGALVVGEPAGPRRGAHRRARRWA